MQHGGSKSIGFSGRRWATAIVGLIAFLTLTGVSGPADLVERPLKLKPGLHAIIARPIVPTAINSADLLLPTSIAAASTGDRDVTELLRDADGPSAHPVTIAADALITPAKPRTLWMEVTAYCPCKKCCGSHATGITSSGRPITYNGGKFVAADLKLLPYGTRVIVPGYNDGKPVEVIDRGGAIRGSHIDIFMKTHEEAVEWGKKRLQVVVVD